MGFVRWLHQVSCAIWAEFVRNPKVYALLAGQPIMLGVVFMWVDRAAEPRWGRPEIQLEILKLAILALLVTHAIVAIAMAAVKVHAKGPGGSSLTVGGEQPTLTATATAEVAVQGEGREPGHPDRPAASD